MAVILRSRHWAIAGTAAIAAFIAAFWSSGDCDICEAATDILLRGTAAQNCTVNVLADAQAVNLPLTTTGAQRVLVGSIEQSCNKKVGYTLSVTSTNCGSAPAGAKLLDPVGGEYLAYSGEFANPTTGGSQASVTGLLASTCTSQVGRDVTNAKIAGETSTVYVNYTGSDALGAGTYQDTLTVTMNVKN